MKEKLYYKCLLCGRTSELNKNMETIEIDGIRMFLLSTIEYIKQIIFKLENQPEKDNKSIQSWKLQLGYALRRKQEYEYYLGLLFFSLSLFW